MTQRVWDEYGDCLSGDIAKLDAQVGSHSLEKHAHQKRRTSETNKAWITLLSFLLENMKTGYQLCCRRQSSVVRKKTITFYNRISQASMHAMPPLHHHHSTG